jgi:DNA-binding LacI/PurR family transcriptional regulator
MGSLAAALLLKRLEEPDRPVERRVLDTYLVERESTGPVVSEA